MANGDPYFDFEDSAHLALLPAEVRSLSDLENLVARAEAEILSFFTLTAQEVAFTVRDSGRTRTELLDGSGDGIGIYIYLKGYDLDPDDAEANFATAFRREISGAITWLIEWDRNDRSIASEGDGIGKSRTYRTDATDPLPPDFPRFLQPFDSREPAWSL